LEPTPRLLDIFPSKVTHIAATVQATYFVIDSNHVVAVGRNFLRKLSKENSPSNSYPFSLKLPNTNTNMGTIKQISSGMNHVIILTGTILFLAFVKYSESGQLWSTGDNNEGQLGIGEEFSKNFQFELHPVRADAKFTEISTGCYHSFAVSDQNELFCWGLGSDFQLGNGIRSNLFVPTKVSLNFPGKITLVSGGWSHSVVVINS
jgi:alpha-tubulin suppressor-like RCC1 family protein